MKKGPVMNRALFLRVRTRMILRYHASRNRWLQRVGKILVARNESVMCRKRQQADSKQTAS
jgi:hypothetical protein